MIINKNINALKTEGNLKRVNEKNAKALEKLSSGLRINRAADDSAGLAIAEKMRAQIRGLNQASRNLQDGISLVQTADSALGNVHDILKRGKELCIQAANDTNTQEDRQTINEELKQLRQQIDKIGTDTEFNTIKLFMDGGSPLTDQAMYKMIAEVWVANAFDAISNTFSIFKNAGLNEPLKIVFSNNGNNGTMASMSGNGPATGPTDFTLNINTYYFENAKINNYSNSGGGTPVTGNELYDKIIAHEMMHAVMYDTMWQEMIPGGDIPSWFKEGVAEAVGGGFYRIAGDNPGDIQNGLNDNSVPGSDYSSGYAASMYLGYLAGGSNMNNITDGLNKILTDLAGGMSFDNALKANLGGMNTAAFVTDFKNSGTANAFITNLQTTVRAAGGSGSVLTSSGLLNTSALTTTPIDTLDDTANPAISAANFIIKPLGNNNVTINSLLIHSGANTNQNITVNRFGLSADILGIPSMSIMGTQKSYDIAIKSYDDAVNKVSNMRSYYGAIQNRMEYAMENVDNYAENLQSAESRIRDVDMSLMMMEFTKTNILSQSATAMLSQANQMPQNILTLLR